MPELVFEVVQDSDGGYCAECLTENIITEGNAWDEPRKNVVEATISIPFRKRSSLSLGWSNSRQR